MYCKNLGVHLCLLSIIINIFLCPNALAIEWTPDDAMESIGVITKVTPTNYSSLHFGGGSVAAETATYTINIDNLIDNDKCRTNSSSPWVDVLLEGEDALDVGDTDWFFGTWETGDPGTLTDGSLTTTFTPGDDVGLEVPIKVTLHDVDTHGAASSETITSDPKLVNVYKLGVNVSGPEGSVNYYEDSESESVDYVHAYTNELDIDVFTTIGATSTYSSSSGDLKTWELSASWAPIENPSVSGRNPDRGLQFSPYLKADGSVGLSCYGSMFNLSGTASAAIVALAGVAGTLGGMSTAGVGYVVAAATIGTSVASSGGQSDVSGSVGGKACIEAVDSPNPNDNQFFISEQAWAHYIACYTYNDSQAGKHFADLSSIDTTGTVVVPDAGKSSFGGKISIAAPYAYQDTGSWIDQCGIKVWTYTGTWSDESNHGIANLKYGVSSTPTYADIPVEE